MNTLRDMHPTCQLNRSCDVDTTKAYNVLCISTVAVRNLQARARSSCKGLF